MGVYENPQKILAGTDHSGFTIAWCVDGIVAGFRCCPFHIHIILGMISSPFCIKIKKGDNDEIQ